MKCRLTEQPQPCEFNLPIGGRVVLGRQTEEEMRQKLLPRSADHGGAPGGDRVIMAWAAEFSDCSQRHVGLEALEGGRVRVTNHSRFPLHVVGRLLTPGDSDEFTAPFKIHLPRRTLSVEADAPVESASSHELSMISLPPNLSLAQAAGGLRPRPTIVRENIDQLQLIKWLDETLEVIQAAIGSPDFLNRAAEALVDIVGLNSGCVLLRPAGGEGRETNWNEARPVAAHPMSHDEVDWRPSRSALRTVLEFRKVYWPANKIQEDDSEAGEIYRGESQQFKGLVVAAPLWDSQKEVIGMLYGECRAGGSDPDPLKLALIKLLANGVSAGLARECMEREAAREAAKFEQEAARFEAFFSKKLAQKLRNQRDLLVGRNTTVTILFCDIRGYSTISSRHPATLTEKWLRDVLDRLSNCILNEDGVVVDYIGDEVMAMWGAPEEQRDQTDRALRAGLAMVRELESINREWEPLLGAKTNLGVGIHRGEAQVGNCGTDTRFKYGALGDTVNRASRVQGMTKYLKCRVLLTEAAKLALAGKPKLRRVVMTRLSGIDEPVNLYEPAAPSEDRENFFAKSQASLDCLEQALQRWENGKGFDSVEFSNAAGQAGSLLQKNPGDGPLLLTLARATEALIRDGQGCSKVWTPPGK